MTQPNPEQQPTQKFRYHYLNLLALSDDNWFDRVFVPILLAIQIIYSVSRILIGDWILASVSFTGFVLLLAFASSKTLQDRLLRQRFTRSHAFYLMTFWVNSVIWVIVYRILSEYDPFGKDSRPFYIFTLLFIGITFRLLLSLYALTPLGYRVFISKIPIWEQVLVAINEFVASGVLAYALGGEIARFIQPTVFTLRFDWVYTFAVLGSAALYYLIMQMMWVQKWNNWLSHNSVWVGFARLISPLALVGATLVIVRHFSRLSEPRSANLLATANLDQTILALSPIVWMMIFFIMMVVYTGSRGLRRRLLPDKLLEYLPERIGKILGTISDMDILLLFGLFSTSIPVQLILFNNRAFISELQLQLTRQNAIIDSSEQALALIFALPFYLVAVALLALYAYAMSRADLSARDRDSLVERLPITLLIVLIITLYLAAIPFNQVLTSGRVPNFQQDLGYILAFDVLIPLILLYLHYFVLIRLPYGRGQSTWRIRQTASLESRLKETESQITNLQNRIDQCEVIWQNRDNLRTNQNQRIDMLFDLIELNGNRDRLNMERLQILADRQELAELSETPVSLTVARLPARVFGYGIPLILVFKIYEWAIVNDGLREVANNPNIGVLEFFQTILENTNF